MAQQRIPLGRPTETTLHPAAAAQEPVQPETKVSTVVVQTGGKGTFYIDDMPLEEDDIREVEMTPTVAKAIAAGNLKVVKLAEPKAPKTKTIDPPATPTPKTVQ